jgi:hypothetical protein
MKRELGADETRRGQKLLIFQHFPKRNFQISFLNTLLDTVFRYFLNTHTEERKMEMKTVSVCF